MSVDVTTLPTGEIAITVNGMPYGKVVYTPLEAQKLAKEISEAARVSRQAATNSIRRRRKIGDYYGI